jgi:hypothetical protein
MIRGTRDVPVTILGMIRFIASDLVEKWAAGGLLYTKYFLEICVSNSFK